VNSPPPPELPDRLRQLLARARSGAALQYLGAALVLAAALVVIGHDVATHVDAVAGWIDGLGHWGPIAYVLIFIVATTLLVPESLLGITAGALFGVGPGLALTLLGSVAACALQYGLAHGLLRDRVQRALGARPSVAAIMRAIHTDELRLQVLLRLTPLNPAIVSYLLGAAGVRFGGFLLTSLAQAPHILFEVWFGNAGRQVATAGASGSGLHSAVVGLGLVVGLVGLIVVSRAARRALTAVVSPAAEPHASGPE